MCCWSVQSDLDDRRVGDVFCSLLTCIESSFEYKTGDNAGSHSSYLADATAAYDYRVGKSRLEHVQERHVRLHRWNDKYRQWLG